MPQKTPITDLTLEALSQQLLEEGHPSYRLKQLLYWVYSNRVDTFDAMTNISKSVRALWAERFNVEKLSQIACLESKDKDAVKFGFSTPQGVFESVLLIDGKRRTLCVSSQLGCALGCSFCETGTLGFIRNLTQTEIVGQLIAANDYLQKQDDKLVTNIVFMGMGEALLNFDIFLSALKIIMHEDCFGIGGRRITVSTAGIVPAIEKLIQAHLNVGLAISLNTYSNAKRDLIMPINKKYPIEEIVKAGTRFHRVIGQPLTFEYVAVKGDNDTREAVAALAKLLKGVPCKLNIIPLNPNTDTTVAGPSQNKIDQFAEALSKKGLMVTVRKSRGRDICGACGQLAGKQGFHP